MKSKCLLLMVLFAVISCPPLGRTQSREDAIRLHKDAWDLTVKQHTSDNLKSAAEKFEEALRIYLKLGDLKNAARIYSSLGVVYTRQGKAKTAVEYFSKSIECANKIGEARLETENLDALGLAHRILGQHAQATKSYERSLEIKKKIGDVEGEARILDRLGQVYRVWGENEKALELHEKALEIARRLGLVEIEAVALKNLGRVHRTRGDYVKAVEFSTKSLEIARKSGDPRGEADALTSLGLTHYDLGRYQQALECHEKSLEIARKIRADETEADALTNLALLYQIRGWYEKAADFYEEALGISRKIGYRAHEAITLSNLGNVYESWGRYGKAAEYQEKSLEIAREISDSQQEVASLNNLANLYAIRGQSEKATGIYEKALGLSIKKGDAKGEGLLLMNLGRMYQARGDLGKALERFQKSVEAYARAGLPTYGPKYSIGDLYLEMGDMDRAEPFLKEAHVRSGLARLYLARSEYQEAQGYYEEILGSAEFDRDAIDLFIGATGLGMAFEGMGDDTKAAEYYSKAVGYTEDLRSGLSQSETEKFLDVRIGGFLRTAPYEGLARVLVRQNRPMEALNRSEYTKARSFAEALRSRSEGTSSDVPHEILERDSQLNDQLTALTKSLRSAREKKNRELIDALEPQVKEVKEKFTQHVAALRGQHPLFAATRYPEPMDLRQSSLKDDEWVLAYDVTDTGIVIYLTKGKQLIKSLFKPVSRKEVDELVRRFREPLEIGPEHDAVKKLSAFDFVSGKRISDLLLADVLPELPRDVPLIIVPDDSLGVIPFEMLLLNDGGKLSADKDYPSIEGADFFCDRNPISYYQSITALTLRRILGSQRKNRDKVLAMVDPVFSADDARLVKVARTQQGVSRDELPVDLLMSIKTEIGITFPRLPLTGRLGESMRTMNPMNTDLCLGTQASKAALLGKDLGSYDSIVFATHGYFGKDLPGIQEPVIVFTLLDQPKGQDGFLRLSEVIGLKITADVVALTACQTGLGQRISGEGTMGMGRAFQYAGARCVLMSLWSVAEASSVQLVESFFRNMKEGKNKLQALQVARKEIRDQGYQHPFFWAAFILVGEAN